jgi:hypothetical protein
MEARAIANKSRRTRQRRRGLGRASFKPEPDRAVTALDIFAMPEPLSAKGERLWRQAMKQVERDRKDRRLNGPRDIAL